jgi:hypothetical protein
LVKIGMPLDSAEAADGWRTRQTHAPTKPPASGPVALENLEQARPPEAAAPIDASLAQGDGPIAAYERQRVMERAAYDRASAALKTGRGDAGRLMALHTQAVKNLIDARSEVMRLQEQEKTLVSGAWVKKVMLEHDGAVATLVKAMPKQLAGRILPHDPEFAETELERWVQEVLLKTLHDTSPWR